MKLKQRIKITGQLIEDKKPTTLLVTGDPIRAMNTAEEWAKEFPEAAVVAEWGYFKPEEISSAKKKALSNLLGVLCAPLNLNLSPLK